MSNGSAPRFSRIASILLWVHRLLRSSATRCHDHVSIGCLRTSMTCRERPVARRASPGPPRPRAPWRRMLAASIAGNVAGSAGHQQDGPHVTSGSFEPYIQKVSTMHSSDSGNIAATFPAMIPLAVAVASFGGSAGLRPVENARMAAWCQPSIAPYAAILPLTSSESGRFPGNIRPMREKTEEKRLAILRILREADGPLGSSRITERLAVMGHDISERTVRFHLLDMDSGRSHREPGSERAGHHPARRSGSSTRPGASTRSGYSRPRSIR